MGSSLRTPCLQVDQTQKYSSLLAQRLGVGGEELLALPAPQAAPKAEDGSLEQAQAAKAPLASDVKAEEIVSDAGDVQHVAGASVAITDENLQGAQVNAPLRATDHCISLTMP